MAGSKDRDEAGRYATNAGGSRGGREFDPQDATAGAGPDGGASTGGDTVGHGATEATTGGGAGGAVGGTGPEVDRNDEEAQAGP